MLRAGVVGKPHGLDGSFHVSEPNPSLLAVGAHVLIAGAQREIVRRAGTARRPIVRIARCEDRGAAQSLHGADMLVARVDAPELGPDEWWAEDLEGAAVRDGERPVGVVTRLLALPSCEVLEVERNAGGAELLVPLVSDAVRSVDLERREIQIDLEFLGEA